MLEREACLKLGAQNDNLRRQLGKMTEITTENQRLSNLVAQASAARLRPDGSTGANGVADEQREELARLRSQVEAFRQQTNEVANLRADTSATRAAFDAAQRERRANRNNSSNTNGASFEILAAYYGTDHTNLDVATELGSRIRGGSLKTVASNRLLGDPDFGVVKNLTIVYLYGGVIMTNQYRENDIVILPPDGP